MINIPQAREKALQASLPTFVLDGSVFLSIRLTQASGGSNSVLDPLPEDFGDVMDSAAAGFASFASSSPAAIFNVPIDGSSFYVQVALIYKLWIMDDVEQLNFALFLLALFCLLPPFACSLFTTSSFLSPPSPFQLFRRADIF